MQNHGATSLDWLGDKYFECSNHHRFPPQAFLDETLRGDAEVGMCTICSERLQLITPSVKHQFAKLWIFVDNSNLFVEAKKLKSQHFNFASEDDPRLRIDILKLAELIQSRRESDDALSRRLVAGKLYGSELGSCCNKIVAHPNWDIITHPRSARNREKKVDTTLIRDVRNLINDVSLPSGGTIAVVSGDVDVKPCITPPVGRNMQWKIEVWMWDRATAGEIKQLAKSHPDIVSWIPLDEYLTKISFTEFRISVKQRWNTYLEKAAVVIKNLPQFDRAQDMENWRSQLESALRWPFQFEILFHEGSEEGSMDAVLVFSTSKKRSDVATTTTSSSSCSWLKNRDKQFKELVEKVQRIHPSAVRYTEFKERLHGRNPIELFNHYDELTKESFEDVYDEVCSIQPGEDGCAKQGTAEDDRQVVGAKEKRDKLFSESCRYRSMCKYGKNCRHTHSTDEVWYFNHIKKHIGCEHGADCQKLPDSSCPFAHTPDESFCRQCHRRGHLELDCKSRDTKKNVPCDWHFACKAGKACLYQHTDREREFFEKNRPGSAMCGYGTECKRRGVCNYAHTKKEMFCVMCGRHAGHLRETCTRTKADAGC